MSIKNIIEQISESLVASMDKLPNDFHADLRKNSKIVLQSALSHLDLVTREEFDAQTVVLHRTRDKLEQLEQQFSELHSPPH